MSARDTLRQLLRKCIDDCEEMIEKEDLVVAEAARKNGLLLAAMIVNATEEECQRRVDVLKEAAPELFVVN